MAIQTLNTIKAWFKTGLKPNQNQFWDTWDSFRHKFEKVPLKEIEDLETILDTKAEKSQLSEHNDNQSAHAELFSIKENKSEKGISGGYVPLDEFSKITSQYLNIINDLVTGGETSLLSAEQGTVLQNQVNNINTLLSSDNFDLNTIQKIADVLKQIQISLNTILVNDLTTGGVTKALTAEMGKQLNEIKLTATIATDSETQIETEITEDNKAISRLKLFNWWFWIKKQSQNITGNWNFIEGLKVEKSSETYTWTSQLSPHALFVQVNSIYGLARAQYEASIIRFISNGFTTELQPSTPTKFNTIKLPNNSGIVALTNDFIITPAGTSTSPSLIIPNGELTTIPQNGAIERDENGALWETHNGVRYRLLTTLDIPVDFINNATAARTPSLDDLNIIYPKAPIGSNVYFTKISGTPSGQMYNFRKSSLGWINAGLVQFLN